MAGDFGLKKNWGLFMILALSFNQAGSLIINHWLPCSNYYQPLTHQYHEATNNRPTNQPINQPLSQPLTNHLRMANGYIHP